MRRLKSFKTTLSACYAGYVCQAIVNNFAPLLFLTFQSQFGIPLVQVTLLITVNFGMQLFIDLVSAKLIDKIGYRTAGVAAHIFIAVGLVLLSTLPSVLNNAFAGLMIAVIVYSIGGGMTEVMLSPLVESCPTSNKSATMSLLHSFYCWGSVAVIGVSTLFFSILGTGFWDKLALIWAVIPALNAVYFLFVPINPISEETRSSRFGELFKSGMFWVLAVMMFCAGAGELAVAQWASAFAESGLGVTKTLGDLIGPCLFAVMMGAVRLLYARGAHKVRLTSVMLFSAALCAVSYLIITLSPLPELSLAGCAVCGISVAMMWPGTFSIAAKNLPKGGTAMFALLALAGDLGCTAGPTLVGAVSDALGDDLQKGILAAVIFPLIMLAAVFACKRAEKKNALSDGLAENIKEYTE